jgi:hypothetical protein
MAVGDVYRAKVTAEGREGEWSMTFHYQELTSGSLSISTKALSQGLAEHLTPTLRACLSSEHEVSRYQVDKLGGTVVPNATFSLPPATRIGTQVGAALPASSPVVLKLLQSFFPAKSNGQVWMSGVPADAALGSVLIGAYSGGVLSVFLMQLAQNVPEPSAGEGLWRLVVLSRKFLEENPEDFEGASAVVEATGFDPRLGRMRSRGFGGRRRKKKEEEVPPPE